ncbi:hypothetical protein N8I77_011853 [Diaporthe amygdali]|uniref:Uncharacterized protein n=1 Tax=Phomopsis amygdali TaxID=1214568 RepID=A0AAD9S4I9_PHOAM|nr:hypothetical protein N8I77_011853 [Diaporthe amygdali]
MPGRAIFIQSSFMLQERSHPQRKKAGAALDQEGTTSVRVALEWPEVPRYLGDCSLYRSLSVKSTSAFLHYAGASWLIPAASWPPSASTADCKVPRFVGNERDRLAPPERSRPWHKRSPISCTTPAKTVGLKRGATNTGCSCMAKIEAKGRILHRALLVGDLYLGILLLP